MRALDVPSTRSFVSSEAHRTSEPINFDEFGAFVDYGLKGGMAEYSRSKLHLCTYATELAARLNPLDEMQVAVHSLCPGPIASNIAREAPLWLEPLLNPLMRLLFSTPARAANAVMLLAGASSMQVRNGVYLHMMREKVVSELASDPVNRQLLWEKSELLLGQYLTPGSHLDLPQRSEESSS
jgi:NAD(P)-dependent dehydrogenase (short-subunit alcohol dehydrogenase family)